MASAEQTLPLNFAVFSRMTTSQKLGTLVAVAMAIALAVGGVLWASDPPYGVVFANLSEKDGGQIVAALEQQNVPYRISEGGSAIMVPSDRVHDVRLRLASQGLPKGGLVGFEVMETQKLGISQFAEQINYQRALEGELARSIQSLGAVRGARVHLAIPKQTAFLRDEQKPTASVLVALHAGRRLDPAQVAGIVHLVSSSVPQLTPTSVSVIDQDGNLVSEAGDASKMTGLDPSQIKYVRDIEQEYRRRVESILAPLVGANNVRAQVTADVDFTQTEQLAETYKPNPNPETTIRSQQTAETGSSAGTGAIGVPGALTNQPPVPATAPITNPSVPGAGGAGSPAPLNFSKNATVNYEVDKTVKHTKGAPGIVRRLAVAVVINHKHDPAKNKSLPLTDTELKQATALAQEAVGFSRDRGDTVNVANVSFARMEQEAVADFPIWKDPWLLTTLKEIGRWLVFAILAWLLWSKAFKPLFEMFAAAAHRVEVEQAAAAEAASESAPEIRRHGGDVRNYDTKLAQARDLAKQDPKLVAGVIKEWVGGESR